MKNALQIRTLTTAIAICVAPAIVAQSSAEGEAETMSETPVYPQPDGSRRIDLR